MARIKTASMLYFSSLQLDAPAIANLAKYTQHWIKTDFTYLLDPPSEEPPMDWARVKATYFDPVKAINPDSLSGLYCYGPNYARQTDPLYPMLDGDETGHPADNLALHAPDGTPLVYEVQTGVFSRWANIISDGNRAYFIAQYLALFQEYEIDLAFFDGWDPASQALRINASEFSFTGGIREGPFHLTATWEPILGEWTTEFRDAFEADGRQLWLNGIGNSGFPLTAFMGAYNTHIVDYGSAMYESWYTIYGDAALFAAAIAAVRTAQAREGGAIWCHSIPYQFIANGIPLVPVPDDTTLLRFYLAAYLLIADHQSLFAYQRYTDGSYLGFDPQGAVRVRWYEEYEHDYGDFTGERFDGGTTAIWWRRSTVGFVIVNPTSGSLFFDIPGSYRVWHPTDGPRVDIEHDNLASRYVVPARSGAFLFNELAEAA